MFGYVQQIICVMLVWFLPESPKLLVELNRFDEAEAAMVRIAKFGGTEFDPVALNEINNGVRNSMKMNMSEARQATVVSALRKSASALKTSGLYEDEVAVPAPPLWYFLKQRTILVNLIALTFIWIGTVYNSYLITYLLNMF